MISNTKALDLLTNITIEDSPYVGKSIAVIGKFAKDQLPVPNGFALSYYVLQQYFDQTEIRSYFNNSRNEKDRSDIIKVIESSNLPGQIQSEILKLYAKISGFADAYVNIKALILDDQSSEVKHKNYLISNIRGESQLIHSIHKLYLEILNDKLDFISRFFSGELKIVLIVQKAIQSEASGIMYTTDIITRDSSKLNIEAVFGLNTDAEFEGLVPDQYIFDKNSNEILEKHISLQEFMLVRQLNAEKPVQKVLISPAWQKRQKLDDKHIIVLAKTGLIIEEELQQPQIITWSYEAGKIWINFTENALKNELMNSDSVHLQNQIDASIQEELEGMTKLQNEKYTLEEKNKLVDLVLDEDIVKQQDTILENITMQEKQEYKKEPLLEGMYYSGLDAEGFVIFDHEKADKTNILVLTGDEDISSNLKVAGFIIEDESDILAERLHEYFKVPVITGVSMARKILKEGEKISIDARNGHIYELVPFTPEKDINLKTKPILEEKAEFADLDFIETPIQSSVKHEEFMQKNNKISLPKNEPKMPMQFIEPEIELKEEQDIVEKEKITLYEDQKVTIEKRHTPPQIRTPNHQPVQKKDISKLLDLIQEETDLYQIKEPELNTKSVEGISSDDQMKVWGRSLENIISASKKMPAQTAANVLEKVIEETNNIKENSKEFEFDREELYIAQSREQIQEVPKSMPFIPTATKVYIHLIDEKLDANLQNFDGIIFSSTQEPDIMLDLLETVLESSVGKEVITICPPYENEALNSFLNDIYQLRNKGYRNLSLITPDYRNKKEISSFKKQMTITGLKRSSTFGVYANISRTINVFRISELEEGMIDGVYVDLFRLKMNMLGVEKLSASTKYVEGMKNLVNYIHENLKVNRKSLIDISAFENHKKVIDHICNFGFWGIVCEPAIVNDVKKYISKLEQSQIDSPSRPKLHRRK